MSLVTVHAPYTMGITKQADDPESPGTLYEGIQFVANGEATWIAGSGTEEPENLGELRQYGAGDITGGTAGDGSTWVGSTGAFITITATGRTYHWDGTDWQPGAAA